MFICRIAFSFRIGIGYLIVWLFRLLFWEKLHVTKSGSLRIWGPPGLKRQAILVRKHVLVQWPTVTLNYHLISLLYEFNSL